MGNGRLLVLLFVKLHSTNAACSQSYNDYLNKGLTPNIPPPHDADQIVSYSCPAGREVPGYSSVSSTCVDTL